MSTEISSAFKSETLLDRIADLLRLRAESAGLSWRTAAPRIKAIAVELNELAAFDRPREPIEMGGFFRGFEEFSAMWVAGQAEVLPFLWAAADFVAEQVVQEFTTPETHNSLGFAHLFGVDAVEALVEVLRGSIGSIEEQYRRLEIVDEDDEGVETGKRHAPIGSDDSDFDEGSMVLCDQSDEHASLITFMDLDEDAYDGLRELIEKKSEASRRVLLAPPASLASPLQSTTLERA